MSARRFDSSRVESPSAAHGNSVFPLVETGHIAVGTEIIIEREINVHLLHSNRYGKRYSQYNRKSHTTGSYLECEGLLISHSYSLSFIR